MLYKIGATHAECQQFYGMICPAQEGAPSTGDVPVVQIVLYGVNPNPDPTDSDKPKYVYDDNPGIFYYDNGHSKMFSIRMFIMHLIL